MHQQQHTSTPERSHLCGVHLDFCKHGRLERAVCAHAAVKVPHLGDLVVRGLQAKGARGRAAA